MQTLQELLGKIINKVNNWIFSTVSGLISSVHHQSVSTLQVAPCPSESSEENMAEQNGKLMEIVVESWIGFYAVMSPKDTQGTCTQA